MAWDHIETGMRLLEIAGHLEQSGAAAALVMRVRDRALGILNPDRTIRRAEDCANWYPADAEKPRPA